MIRYLLVFCLAGIADAWAQPIEVVLPTTNEAIYHEGGSEYYMYTNRFFEGVRTAPWEGGTFGFTRNQVRMPDGSIVYTRFHEGIDVKPRFRDRRGEPLDTVRAIDDGVVRYVNATARRSSYGLYLVIEHEWQGSLYFTLYSHLNSIVVQSGQRVRRGQSLGRLGYTGVGIDRVRSHLHFEINIMLSRQFPMWFSGRFPRDENDHGLYHGVNLAGFNPTDFFTSLYMEPDLDLGQLLRGQAVAFSVHAPGGYLPDVVLRYPWLAPSWTFVEPPPAWVIHFTQSGFPVRFEPVEVPLERPAVFEVSEEVRYRNYSTNGLLERGREDFVLTERGQNYIRLVMSRPDGVPTW